MRSTTATFPTQPPPPEPPKKRRSRRLVALLVGGGIAIAVAILIVAVMDDSSGNGASDDKDESRPAQNAPANEAAETTPHAGAVPGAGDPAHPAGKAAAAPGGAASAPSPSAAASETKPSAPPGKAGEKSGEKGSEKSNRKESAAEASAKSHADKKASKEHAASPDGGDKAGEQEADVTGAGGGSGPNRRSEGRSLGEAPSRSSLQRTVMEADARSRRVARFVPVGGAGLRGRVVEAETGRALGGVSVEAHLEGNYMETATDGGGAFRMVGLFPGKRVKVWVIGKPETHVAEYAEVAIPGEGETADSGQIALLRGNEMGGQRGGWTGLFVGRRGRRAVITAINPWLPADRAGLEVGDAILSIEGRDLEGLGPRATSYLLRGPVGSHVTSIVESRQGASHKVDLERVPR